MENGAALTGAGTIDTGNWEELMCSGAQEVFEMMINVPLSRRTDTTATKAGQYTAVIGVAGPINGVFAVRCEETTAIGIACGMLGMEPEAAKAEVWDALGEVCNMVIGNFKAKTGVKGASSVLSVPTVIHGHDYRVRPLVNGSFVEVMMQTADGLIQFRLDYKIA